MWYVIQTVVGHEEELISMIHKIVDASFFTKCFVPKYENVWKKQGISNVSIEQLFKGYVFIETKNPKELFYQLKRVPALSKMLTDGDMKSEYAFLSVYKDEEQFLKDILMDDAENVVRLSYVKRNEKKRIYAAAGPLMNYLDKIVDVDYRHRRVFIEVELFGKMHRIKLGIKTDEDYCKEGKSVPKMEMRMIDNTNVDKKLKHEYEMPDVKVGDIVRDKTGIYGDDSYEVKRINERRRTVIVEVEMFGMPIEVELLAEQIEIV